MPSHFRQIVTISWIYCILAAVSISHAGGNVVARVTDLQGTATEMVNGQARNLRILARLKDGAVIELQRGATITLHFSAKRRDMRFIGPGTVRVKGQSANATNGVASTKDHTDIGISLDLSGSGLGGIIARSLNMPEPKVNLQHPVKTKVIADRPLSFKWSSGGATAAYTLSLQLRGGPVVFTARTTDTEMDLPPEVQLQPGKRYRWTITTSLDNAEAVQSAGGFTVADASETTKFYAMASTAKDKVSDLVLYALQLDRLKLGSEAEPVWQQLETLRPGISASR